MYMYVHMHMYMCRYIYMYICIYAAVFRVAGPPPMVWVPPSPSVLHAICSISDVQPRICKLFAEFLPSSHVSEKFCSISDFQRFMYYLLEGLYSTLTPSKDTYS